MNTQKPEPFAHNNGKSLDVHSIFNTIQGEGPYIGHRATFVRLAGCNLKCPGCDTEYTKGRNVISKGELVEIVEHETKYNKKSLVVITGGEPLRQNIGPFIHDLLDLNKSITVQIESNGMFTPDNSLHYLLLHNKVDLIISPKTPNINNQNAYFATAFKYVLDYQSVGDDGLPNIALGLDLGKPVARPPPNKPVYLNPMDTGNAEHNKLNMQAVVHSCLKHGYIAGIQMHKYLGVE